MLTKIISYKEQYKEQVIQLITGIQMQEFNLPVSREMQPDLEQISTFYQTGVGNFWVALNDYDNVIGSAALIDIGNNQVAVRKFFVDIKYRGKEKQVSRMLMQTLFNWARSNQIKELYLGTISVLIAAQKFYEKHGFIPINKLDLPRDFPIMELDSKFYVYKM